MGYQHRSPGRFHRLQEGAFTHMRKVQSDAGPGHFPNQNFAELAYAVIVKFDAAASRQILFVICQLAKN